MDQSSIRPEQEVSKQRRARWMHSQPKISCKDEMREQMSLLETKTRPNKICIELQPELGWTARFQLVCLLVKSQQTLELCSDALFLAVNILDRYAAKRVIKPAHYKLLGGTALLIARKYLDRRRNSPTTSGSGWQLLSDYDKKDIVHMEKHILETLDYLIGYPSLPGHIQIELVGTQVSRRLGHMISYICKTTLCYPEFVSVPSIIMARSAIVIARCATGEVSIPTVSSDSESRERRRVLCCMFRRLLRPPKILHRTYSRQKTFFVAMIMHKYLGDCDSLPHYLAFDYPR